ncbi:MAG: AmmeMemoRadiSam system radical SAM enzyme [Pseudomonadota bacterium]
MKEAMLYTLEKEQRVKCHLCRHGCIVYDGKRGICNVRENRAGKLFSILYGKPCTISVDPIEKKPLFHFYPGSKSLSLCTLGCNFKCSFCQNWRISQYEDQGDDDTVSPEEVVALAKEHAVKSISYTYTEPTIFFEYAYDIAKLAKDADIANNFVTNGYMTREALDTIKPYLDATNIDLKSFRKDTYRKYMKAGLDGVLDSIKYMKELGIWIEVTTLIVPGMNDDESELKDIANFLVNTGRDIPWHISRFTPQYKETDRPPTPVKKLYRAYEIGKEAGINYVYVGNLPTDEKENTYCHGCNALLIERSGFSVVKNSLEPKGICSNCKTKIAGVF